MLVPVMRSGRISSSSSTCSTAIWASPLAPPEPSARPRVGRCEAPAWPQSSPRVRAAASRWRTGRGRGRVVDCRTLGYRRCRREAPRGALRHYATAGPRPRCRGGGLPADGRRAMLIAMSDTESDMAEPRSPTPRPAPSAPEPSGSGGRDGGGGNAPSGLPRQQWLLFVWMAVALLLMFHYLDGADRQARVELTYSDFLEAVDAGHVDEVTLRGQALEGVFSDSGRLDLDLGETRAFTTTRPDVESERLLERLEAQQVRIAARPAEPEAWQRLLMGVVPWLLMLALLFWFWNRMQERMTGGSGTFGMGRSRARLVEPQQSKVRLADVAGSENAKRDIFEVIEFLREPERFQALGARMPRGILMMGPPGTGKTLMAKAVAGEAGVPFFSISGSEFIEMFVGVGASRVRDLFRQAKEKAPSVVFIDEIDSIGRTRGTGVGGGHDEREQTLNQILAELDGFEGHEAVVVLAATNRPDVLDPALLRPGRFDRKVTLENPHREAREAILGVHTRRMPLAGDVDLARLAEITIGFSGADLANLANEAALLAGRRGCSKVD